MWGILWRSILGLIITSGEQVAVGPGFLKHHILHVLRIG